MPHFLHGVFEALNLPVQALVDKTIFTALLLIQHFLPESVMLPSL